MRCCFQFCNIYYLTHLRNTGAVYILISRPLTNNCSHKVSVNPGIPKNGEEALATNTLRVNSNECLNVTNYITLLVERTFNDLTNGISIPTSVESDQKMAVTTIRTTPQENVPCLVEFHQFNPKNSWSYSSLIQEQRQEVKYRSQTTNLEENS